MYFLCFVIITITTDLAMLLSLAQHHIPGARLVEESGREAVINLPQEAAKNSSLAIFLSELDQRLNELGISSYGLSDSTLEEVNPFTFPGKSYVTVDQNCPASKNESVPTFSSHFTKTSSLH